MSDGNRGTGKWAQAGVPHRGWYCVGEDDLGSPDMVCQMCEQQEIRYVHYMQHPDYPDELACGCVCAGHLEENYTAAREREKKLKRLASRREKWKDLSGWRVSAKGNPTMLKDGSRITIFERRGGWFASVATGMDPAQFSARPAPTAGDAKLVAFDMLYRPKRKSAQREP